MTPAELHSRILLHELRTILLDESREGTQLPQAYKDLIQSDPHNPSSYLITAEELEEHADPLAELCRIQVELIGLLPVDWMATKDKASSTHQFRWDWAEFATNDNDATVRAKLLERRMHLTEELYLTPEHTWLKRIANPRLSRLGRTTRMLTDILRYCALNQGKHAMVQARGDDILKVEMWFDRICRQTWGREPAWLQSHTAHMPDNQIHFGHPGETFLVRTDLCLPQYGEQFHHPIPPYVREHFHGIDSQHTWDIAYDIERGAYRGVQTRTPDITFTDHACQLPIDTSWAGEAVLD